MHFVYFTNCQANSQWSFKFWPPLRIGSLVFWNALFDRSFYSRLLLERYFSFRDFVTLLHKIIILLFNCHGVTFYICSLYFVNEKNKETKKQSLNWLKYLSKRKKIIFLIKLSGKNNILN